MRLDAPPGRLKKVIVPRPAAHTPEKAKATQSTHIVFVSEHGQGGGSSASDTGRQPTQQETKTGYNTTATKHPTQPAPAHITTPTPSPRPAPPAQPGGGVTASIAHLFGEAEHAVEKRAETTLETVERAVPTKALEDFALHHAGAISTVASLAAFIPGVDLIAAPVAVGFGGLAAYEDRHHPVAAALDILGAGTGAGAIGIAVRASALEDAARATWRLGPVADWLRADSAVLRQRALIISAGSFGVSVLALHPLP